MKRSQLHLWLQEDYIEALKAKAEANDESVASLIRRLIRHYLIKNTADSPKGIADKKPVISLDDQRVN
jgi:predicted transcriptional regulator